MRGIFLAVWGICGWATLQATPAAPPRDYFRGVHPEERKQIHYIVEILAHKSLASIWMHENELNHAGDRLASMHPFRFLEVLLVDSHVKDGVRRIRDRRLVWPSFYEGIRGSLALEETRRNLTDQQIQDFSHKVQADPAWVSSMVKRKSWESLVEGLFSSKHAVRSHASHEKEFSSL